MHPLAKEVTSRIHLVIITLFFRVPDDHSESPGIADSTWSEVTEQFWNLLDYGERSMIVTSSPRHCCRGSKADEGSLVRVFDPTDHKLRAFQRVAREEQFMIAAVGWDETGHCQSSKKDLNGKSDLKDSSYSLSPVVL